MRRRLASGVAATLGALALAAGCGGGDEGAGETTAPPASTAPDAGSQPAPITVTVLDGDTGQPVPGATVRARVGPGQAETARTDARGTALLTAEANRISATRDGWSTAARPIRPGTGAGAQVELAIHDAALQSPEYGGGPQRTRHVPAVEAGPPQDPPDWTFDAITLIEFPPAVMDGLVVFGVNSGRVFALDAESGDIVWEDRVGGPVASAPSIVDGVAYLSAMDGTLTAFRLRDGRRLWQFSTGESPIESSPLFHEGLIYFGAWNGTVYAVDTDGEQVWTHQMSDQVKGSAALAGDRILIGDYSGRVSALDAASGELLWDYTGGARFYGGPAVSGDTAVIGDVGNAVIALDVRDGSEIWRHTTGDWVYGSPAIAGRRVFIGAYDEVFRALDLRDGSVLWTHDAGGRVSGSATVVDDVVYYSILYREGQPRKTWGLDVATGEVVWQNDDGRYSPVVAAGDTIYVVGTKLLRAYRDDA